MHSISRRAGESIRINDNITVHITRVTDGRVYFAIDAPRDCRIWRAEVYQEINGVGPAKELGGIGAEEPNELGRIEHDATSPKDGLSKTSQPFHRSNQ
ncbi:MAG: carbon storage regulator [Planctomycetota bacterium]